MCRIAFSLLKLFKKRVDEMKKVHKKQNGEKDDSASAFGLPYVRHCTVVKKQHCGGLKPDRQRGIQ